MGQLKDPAITWFIPLTARTNRAMSARAVTWMGKGEGVTGPVTDPVTAVTVDGR
jgi:hypothetical protein